MRHIRIYTDKGRSLKKQTHIARQRKLKRNIRQYAINCYKITDYEYSNIIFLAGLNFLKFHFPEDSSYKPFFDLYSQSKSFWTWYKAEWHTTMCSYFADNKDYFHSTNMRNWKLEIVGLTISDNTYKSFMNYLKMNNAEIYTKREAQLQIRTQEETGDVKVGA